MDLHMANLPHSLSLSSISAFSHGKQFSLVLILFSILCSCTRHNQIDDRLLFLANCLSPVIRAALVRRPLGLVKFPSSRDYHRECVMTQGRVATPFIGREIKTSVHISQSDLVQIYFIT